jgi:transcriptional regulator with XRE-family HTH domain
MKSAFGLALRDARRQRNVSQDQFAEATGLHRTHISLIERGLREPNLDTLVKLSRGLGVTPAEMIQWYAAGSKERRAQSRGGTDAAGHP